MNQNGSVVLQAMEELKKPATVKNIVDFISDMAGVEPDADLRKNVKETLQGGVQYGYVQKKNQKYYMAPLKLAYAADADVDGDMSPNDMAEDRPAGRRRRRRSTPRRSRSHGSRRRSRSRRS